MIARLNMLKAFAASLIRREEGQAAPEYVMIIGFISLVIVLAFVLLGDAITAAATEVVRIIGVWSTG